MESKYCGKSPIFSETLVGISKTSVEKVSMKAHELPSLAREAGFVSTAFPFLSATSPFPSKFLSSSVGEKGIVLHLPRMRISLCFVSLSSISCSGASGETEFSYESKVGESHTEAVWHTVGSATGSSMELAPGQGARVELSSSLVREGGMTTGSSSAPSLLNVCFVMFHFLQWPLWRFRILVRV